MGESVSESVSFLGVVLQVLNLNLSTSGIRQLKHDLRQSAIVISIIFWKMFHYSIMKAIHNAINSTAEKHFELRLIFQNNSIFDSARID